MPLSQTAQDELRAELAAIETMRRQMIQKLDARAEAIKSVLEPFDFNQTALPFSTEGHSPNQDFAARARAVFGSPTIVPNKFASTGLRAAILQVLKDHGPMRASNIAKILERTGFRNDSKTALATRVYNDCWRMIERDLVENKEGAFSLKKTA